MNLLTNAHYGYEIIRRTASPLGSAEVSRERRI